MPSLQSLALLAIASAATAYPWTEDHVARSFEDEYSGSGLVNRDVAELLYERDLFEEFGNLVKHYTRDFDEPHVEGQVLIRSARGGGRPRGGTKGNSPKSVPKGSGAQSSGSTSKPNDAKKKKPKPTASSVYKGVKGVAGIIGDLGTGVSAATSVASTLGIGNGGNSAATGPNAAATSAAPGTPPGADPNAAPQQQRRDLEELYNGGELFARAARRERQIHGPHGHPVPTRGGQSQGEGRYYGSRPFRGHGPELNLHQQPISPSSLKAFEHGAAGGSRILDLVPEGDANSKSKRDLEDLLDNAFEIYARAFALEDTEY